MKTRFLRTVEKVGTRIQHKKTKDISMIVGSDIEGFRVELEDMYNFEDLRLPFKNIDQWEVLEEK